MTSTLQGGFIHRFPRSAPNKCIICHKGGTSAKTLCSTCQSYVCTTCNTAESSNIFLKCDVCKDIFCEGCCHVCSDTDCQRVTCKMCSNMTPCSVCKSLFCKEEAEGDDDNCTVLCRCQKIVCYDDDCCYTCNHCTEILCRDCVRDCNKCKEFFCDKFLIKCEFCDRIYCLICFSKRTECEVCCMKPTNDRVLEVKSQMKKMTAGLKKAQRGAPASRSSAEQHRGNRREGRETQTALVSKAEAEAKEKRIEEAKEKQRIEEATAAAATAAAATAASAAAAAIQQQTSSAARGPNVQPKKSKKKKKKKTKASAANAQATVSTSSPDVDLAPAAAAARLAAPTPAKEVEQLTLASSTSVNGYHSHHSDLVNDHDGGHSSAHHSVDDLVMDHSDIKKWVMSVAACETVATLPEIRRYFHGRVEKVIIDACLVQLHHNFRDTVMACAEFMSIIVPPDLKANIGVKSNEKEQRKEAKQPGEAGAAASLSPDKKEEDDYVAGGYLKPGDSDFDFIEHPLEKRANKARENDCKDVKELQDILDEAKGQPGLARTRKLVSKMLKRVKAELEERKQLRQLSKLQEKPLATKEISQKLHPAYASNGPGYASFKPPSIPDGKQPEATINVPQNVVGWVIGKAGIRIIQLQERTNAAMWIDQNFPNGHARKLHIYGKSSEVEAAVAEVEYLIKSAPINNARRVIPTSEVGAPSCLPPGHPDIPPISSASKTHAHKMVLCPHSLVGLLIGKKGATIMKIKNDSNANVEVNQNFPEGVPREVDITGSPGSVDLAVAMVEEIIASGNRADASTVVTPSAAAVDISSTSTTAFAHPPAPSSTGPVLGFGSSVPMRSPLTPVDAMARDFGDLGGLGHGATSTVYSGMNGAAAAGLQDVDTRSAIEKLHPSIQGGASSAGKTHALSPLLQANGAKVHGSYLDQQGYRLWHQHLHYQHQHQQHPLYPPPPQQQYQPQHPPYPQPLQQQPTASEANGARGGGGGGLGENAGNDGLEVAQDSFPFGSIKELLASVGFPLLLSNFLEQEFDLKSVSLMQDKDFEEIKVPKGPQLKIQRALRAAGIGSAESKSSHVSAAVATPNVATEEKEEEKMPYSEDRCCVICLERKIEVIFLDCGHQICCKQCGDPQVGKDCPMCRTPVAKAVRFYTG